jgi:hypothetical protein
MSVVELNPQSEIANRKSEEVVSVRGLAGAAKCG